MITQLINGSWTWNQISKLLIKMPSGHSNILKELSANEFFHLIWCIENYKNHVQMRRVTHYLNHAVYSIQSTQKILISSSTLYFALLFETLLLSVLLPRKVCFLLIRYSHSRVPLFLQNFPTLIVGRGKMASSLVLPFSSVSKILIELCDV